MTVYLYLVFFYLAAFKRHYALRLDIAPDFLTVLPAMLILCVCSGLMK